MAAYLLAAVAVLAPELLGGATSATALTVYLSVGAISCGALVCLWRANAIEDGIPVAGIAVLLAAVWTFVQAVPLPCFATSWAQPERQATLQQLVKMGAIEAVRCGISAAPGSTWIALAQAACIAALVLTATASARAGARNILIGGIAASAVLMAFVALTHLALSETKVFGLYAPIYVKPRLLLAPLLNENHFAGLMALGWPACLALSFSSRRPDGTVAWGFGALLVFTAGLLSLSRGGVGALAAGGTAFVLWRLLRDRKRGRGSSLVVALSCACIAVGAFVAYDLVAKEFSSQETLATSKLALVAKLFPIFWKHPLVGVGRGALGDVTASNLVVDQRALYTENLPTQWLIEWGLPCTLLVMAALAASALLWRWRDMRSTEVALGCGLLALFAHNLLDFSLELPGVACTAAIALGCLASRERAWSARAGLPAFSLKTWATVACAGAVLGGAVATPWLTFLSKARLTAELSQPERPQARRAAAALHAAFASYPLDPEFIMLGAYRAASEGSRTLGGWLNLAMSVAPGWAAPHLIAAEALERRGALGQAAIELSIAASRAPWPAGGRACAFVKRHPVAELAMAAASDDPAARQRSLENLTACLPARTVPLAGEQLLELILADYPSSVVARQRLVQSALDQGKPELAVERAYSAFRQQPEDPAMVLLLATALQRANRPQEALQVIDSAPKFVREEYGLMVLELAIVSALKLDQRFDSLVERLLSAYGRSAEERAKIHRSAALALAEQHRFTGALRHAQAAYDLSQEPLDLEQVHRSALEAGLMAVALRTASQLCQVRHRAETYCRRGSASASP